LIAIGVSKGESGYHPQCFGTSGNAIRITREGGMTVLILRNGGNSPMQGTFLVHIPRVIGSISRGMSEKEA